MATFSFAFEMATAGTELLGELLGETDVFGVLFPLRAIFEATFFAADFAADESFVLFPAARLAALDKFSGIGQKSPSTLDLLGYRLRS